ncbi:MAG: hypothetical protein ABL949_05985 [Fimbriimonadaceae bacterium]
MKPIKRVIASVLGICFALSVDAQWVVFNLHPAGATYSRAYGVHGSQQVGESNIGGVTRASLWNGTATSWVDLGPAGSSRSWAYGVNGGKQVGNVDYHACFWTGTAGSIVSLNTGAMTLSFAYGASGSQQVGEAYVGGSRRASLWSGTADSWVDLTPAGSNNSTVRGVSGGQQVGWADVGGVFRASLWTGTANSWVDLHPAGAIHSEAVAVGDGQQVGSVLVGGGDHASLWTGTAASWVDLAPNGASSSKALGVSGGWQVGKSTVGGVVCASLWTGTASSWVNLHAVLPSNYSSSEALAIWRDASGTHVVGSGSNSTTGQTEALMWTWLGTDDFDLSLNKSSTAGQNSVLGTITMPGANPTDTVYTTYDNSSLVTTPPSVTVRAGALSRSFLISVTAITGTVTTTIYAKRGAVTRSRILTLTPLIPTAMSFTPNPVTGGQAVSCRFVINGVAGPAGLVVSTTDNSIYATTPATVTVPAGATGVTFPITTLPVTSIKYVTVTARVSAGEKTGTFRINP